MDLIESEPQVNSNSVHLVEPVIEIEVEDEEDSIKFVIEEVEEVTTATVEPVVVVEAVEAVEAVEEVMTPVEPVVVIEQKPQKSQIPKIIYICHKNLDCLQMTHDKWKNLNPNYEIKLFDDAMCEHFLLTEYSAFHCNIFKFIRDGPIKSDFWRLCILYKYGGIYVDADIHPFISINKFLMPGADFVTCITKSNRNFNPHFIAAKKKEHILKRCIYEYIALYKFKKHLYEYWKWSVVHIFNKVLNPLRNPNIQTVTFKKKNFQFLIEQTDSQLYNPSLHDYYCTFKNTRVFNTRYISYDPDAHEFKHHSNQRNTINKKGNSIAIKGGVGLGISGRKSNSNNLFVISFNKQ